MVPVLLLEYKNNTITPIDKSTLIVILEYLLGIRVHRIDIACNCSAVQWKYVKGICWLGDSTANVGNMKGFHGIQVIADGFNSPIRLRSSSLRRKGVLKSKKYSICLSCPFVWTSDSQLKSERDLEGDVSVDLQRKSQGKRIHWAKTTKYT